MSESPAQKTTKGETLSHVRMTNAASRQCSTKLNLLRASLPKTGGFRSVGEQIIWLIGNASLVQQRVLGLVAAEEKPDVLWERPTLDRLYSRLVDEYELKDRAEILTRKPAVISDTAKALSDLIDTQRSLRLEQMVVALILIEILFTIVQIWRH